MIYLWESGLRVAKHTYRYSSARVRQLKTSGHYLWYQNQKHLRRAIRASFKMWANAVDNLRCRRHRHGKSEHRNSTHGKSTAGGEHFRRKLMSQKSMPCLNGDLPHLKRTVSWGELVHLSDERCSTVLKQYNRRVSSLYV